MRVFIRWSEKIIQFPLLPPQRLIRKLQVN